MRPRWVTAALLAGLLSAAGFGGPSAAAAAGEPATLSVAVASGPPGLTVGVSGEHFQAGTTYGLCLLAPDEVQCGYVGSDLGSFTADAGGTVPAGTQVRVAGVLAGSYRLVATAPGTAAIVAAVPFAVTAPSLALGANAGPGGLAVTVAGSGFAPAVAYSLCIVPIGTPECGGVGIPLGDVTADGSGNLPASTTVTIPGQLAATYDVGVMLKGGAVPNLLVADVFVEVAPTIAIDPPSGPGGMAATVTGAGLAPGGSYTVCLVPPGATQCGGAGTILVGFTADASGAVPVGTTVTIPSGQPGAFPVGITLANSTPFLLGSVPFTRTAGSPPPATAPTGPPAAGPSAVQVASPGPSSPAAPVASEQGAGGWLPWILVALAIIVVVVVGLTLSRRRQAAERW